MSQKKLRQLRKKGSSELIKESFLGNEKIGIRQIIKENWKFLTALVIGIFLLYANSLNGAFVSDDYASIPNNPVIMNFGEGLKGSFLGVMNWFLAVTFGIGSPVSFHLFNLIVYMMVCVLAFIFLVLVFNKKIAIFSTILFAVLPVHVEAVSWISGKPYLFTSFTVLFSLIFFILYLKTGIKKYFWFLICFLPITFFAEKVRSISLILLAIFYVFTFGNNSKKKINWLKLSFFGFLGIIVLGLILWPLINFRINNVNSGYNGSGGIFYNPFFQYPTAIAKYLQLALVPADLTLYHTMYIIPDWLNWSIILSYLAAVVYFFFKDKKIFFALGFIFLATAPSMAPVKVSWLVAERYLLLGSLGFCTFLVLFFERLGKKLEVLWLFLFIFLVFGYMIRVFYRNIDWQTNHNLWVNTCQVSPNSHNAWNNIGDDYDKLAQAETTDEGKLKQYENSIKGFTESVTVKPNYADAYHNRANIFYKMGRYDLASQGYETALSYGPNLYQSYFTLIQIDLIEKNYNMAMQHLDRLNNVKPNDPQVFYMAAVVYANMGQKDKAIQILDQIKSVYPQASALLDQLKK
jgi:tetratricopeptide (TPR) repeat protein